VEFWSIADFFSHEPSYDFRTEQNSDEEAGEYCCDGAEHYVLVGVEAKLVGEDVSEIPEQVVNHDLTSFIFCQKVLLVFQRRFRVS